MPVDYTGVLVGIAVWLVGTAATYRVARRKLRPLNLYAATAVAFFAFAAVGFGFFVLYDRLRG